MQVGTPHRLLLKDLPVKLLAATLVVAFFSCLTTTPVVRRLARKCGLLDRPDQHRKLHAESTPLGGGVAILLALLVTIAFVITFSTSQFAAFAENQPFLTGLGAAASLICLIGLLDDRYALRGRQKLLGQILAACILCYSGLVIHRLEFFGVRTELGLLAYPFTIFWILGAINAFNLLDGIDGLASTVGIVLSLGICILAYLSGHITEAFVALAMAGTIAGFLVYNRPPASIFLGDAGSMLIGLVLGSLAIRASLKQYSTVALIVPISIWALPIFDVTMAIIRRRLTGQSIYTTDRGHIHHLLQQRGLSVREVVALVSTLCAVTVAGGVLSSYIAHDGFAYAAIVLACGFLVVTRLFGHREARLVVTRMQTGLRSLFLTARTSEEKTQPEGTHLSGTREWHELWTTLCEFAEDFDLSSIQLNVHSPSMGEEWHAAWNRKMPPSDLHVWHSDIPLVAGSTTIGRLKISGVRADGNFCSWMSELIAGLEPFELKLIELIESKPTRLRSLSVPTKVSIARIQNA